MGMKAGLAAALGVLLAAAPGPAIGQRETPSTSRDPANSEDARLMELLADDARRTRLLDPLDRLADGEPVTPAALELVFTDTLSRNRLASVRQSLLALARVDAARLSPERRLSFEAFTFEKRSELERLQPDIRALADVQPMEHFGGLHVDFPSLLSANGPLPFRSEADYRRALALQQAIPQIFAQAELRFREGMASGVVVPMITVRNMIGQIDALLAQPVQASPFYSPARKFPRSVPEGARERLRNGYATTLQDTVYPAYRQLRTFLNDEYLPAARDSVGLGDLRGGLVLYRHLMRQHTTLQMDPAEVHQLGLSEVARIQREMSSVQRELGDTGSLRAFFDTIRRDPRFHPQRKDDLAKGFARIAVAVDARVPKLFARVPRTRLAIRAHPPYREKYEAGGSYNEGSADGARPGVFFYNNYDFKSRFLTGMTTLYLHEGSPGHHFQISLAQEDKTLPDIQRFDGNTAYVEGWALYAETLGHEMGLYRDPMQHWGMLDDEMLRAMRLVVDTGLHTMGWSRDRAIDYMLSNSGMGRTDATAEVERYIAVPAQALAYKLGALTIQRLRAKAEASLGPKFDIRAFHEQILGSGALPLPVLEAKVDRWIAAQPDATIKTQAALRLPR
ncbi:MAG: DUF885 domain-containing protein [Pseudomonadota bacterium]